MNIEEKSVIIFKVLIDTKPLYNIVVTRLGIDMGRGIEYGEGLLKCLERMKLSLASVWPVFTEVLYFVYRDLKKRKDFSSKLESVKKVLKCVEELDIEFHRVLDKLTPDFDVADTALLELAKEMPVMILSEDYKLVEKARSMGITALTPYELLSIAT